MKSSKIALVVSDGIATLTLNRPEKNNTIDGEMMRAIAEDLEEIGAEGEARILLLRAEGNHFCTGREPGAATPKNAKEWSEMLGGIVRVNRALLSFPGISLALVQGKALGFGCGLAVQSDITLASDDARFAFPEIKAGFPPTIVMSYLSRWTLRKKAFELVITGAEIDAVEAERLGLVNRVVPARDLAAEGERWTVALDKLDARALAACKTFFRDTAYLRPEDAAGYGISLLANFMSSRGT
jgi:methylglutaconyl-CoA hydratase